MHTLSAVCLLSVYSPVCDSVYSSLPVEGVVSIRAKGMYCSVATTCGVYLHV